jgi:hypothetical protein
LAAQPAEVVRQIGEPQVPCWLNAKQALLVEPIGRHADHKSNADIPDGEGSGHYQNKALALVLSRNYASGVRKL